jgi:succinoglycan biosynthesis protein ExoM
MMIAPTHAPVIIGICTFRRASIRATLASLAGLTRPANPVSIIVADNDDNPTAAAMIAKSAAMHPFPIRYIHAPARNISVARNAILEASLAARAQYLAFLDDDETAVQGWLTGLLQRQDDSGAAAVVGPVCAVYGDAAPRWMRRGQVHDTWPDIDGTGVVREGYTCNVLLDLGAPALRGLRFDAMRGRTGGEDTAFFRGLRAQGGEIVAAPDALVHETVPAERASLPWLLRRRYRMGQTHASLIAEGRGWPSRMAALVLAAMKGGACMGMAGMRVFDPLGRNRALMRGALHLGAVAELAGFNRVEIYGGADAAPADREATEADK